MTEYRKWDKVRADRTDLTKDGLAEARRKLVAKSAGYRLAEIRREAGITQTQLAEAMGVSQNRVSVIERGDPAAMELDTVRSYVEALGGHVRVTAEFADHSIDLRIQGKRSKSRGAAKNPKRGRAAARNKSGQFAKAS